MLNLGWQWHVFDDTFLGKLQRLDLKQGLDNHCRKQKWHCSLTDHLLLGLRSEEVLCLPAQL